MTRRRTIWIVALLALLVSAAAPHRAGAAWECDGRVCSTDFAACCCEAPAGAKDANCTTSAQPGTDAAGCAADCGCVRVLVIGHASCAGVAPSRLAFTFHPVVLPGVPDPVVATPAASVLRSFETRGPPLSRAPLVSPSLRAPPAA